MSTDQRSASTASTTTTTPVVTVDRITDAHRAICPGALDRFVFAVSIYVGGVLTDVDALGLCRDPNDLPALRERGRHAAEVRGGTFDVCCDWCWVNCPPDERAEHRRLIVGSETTWRRRAAA